MKLHSQLPKMVLDGSYGGYHPVGEFHREVHTFGRPAEETLEGSTERRALPKRVPSIPNT